MKNTPKRQPAQLSALLALREDAEKLTNAHGATVYRQMIVPRVTVPVGEANDEEICYFRNLMAGGDIASIIGPMESFLVVSGPTAVMLMEALTDFFGGAHE